MQEEINIRVTNSAAIAAGALWFPLSETSRISDKDYEKKFPLRNYSVENQSAQEVDIILNPAPISSAKRWTIPSTKTRESSSEDKLKFHNFAIINNGAAEIAIGELEAQVRNY